MIILVEFKGGESLIHDLDIRGIDTEQKVINDYDYITAKKKSNRAEILDLEPENVFKFSTDVSSITREKLDEIAQINLEADEIKDSQYMTLYYFDEEKESMVCFYTEKALNNLPEELADIVRLIKGLALSI